MIRRSYYFVCICVASMIPHSVSSTVIGLKVNYIQNLCNSKNNEYLKIGSVESGATSSGILKIANVNSWPVNNSKKCNIVLIPPNNFAGITISVPDIKFNPPNEIAISAGTSSITLPYKGNSLLEDVISISSRSGINMTISFSSTPTFTSRLKIIYTAYYKNTKCLSPSAFLCDNGRCISKLLECDGYNHCGDFSAQRNCHSIFHIYRQSTRKCRNIIITFATILMGLMFSCFLLQFFRKRFAQYRHHQAIDNFIYQDSILPSPAPPLITSPYGINSPRMGYPNVPVSYPYISQKPPDYKSPFTTASTTPAEYLSSFATASTTAPDHQSSFGTVSVPPSPEYVSQVSSDYQSSISTPSTTGVRFPVRSQCLLL